MRDLLAGDEDRSRAREEGKERIEAGLTLPGQQVTNHHSSTLARGYGDGGPEPFRGFGRVVHAAGVLQAVAGDRVEVGEVAGAAGDLGLQQQQGVEVVAARPAP